MSATSTTTRNPMTKSPPAKLWYRPRRLVAAALALGAARNSISGRFSTQTSSTPAGNRKTPFPSFSTGFPLAVELLLASKTRLTKRESLPLFPLGRMGDIASYGSPNSTRFESPGLRRTTWRRRPGELPPSCPVPAAGIKLTASAATNPQLQSFIDNLLRLSAYKNDPASALGENDMRSQLEAPYFFFIISCTTPMTSPPLTTRVSVSSVRKSCSHRHWDSERTERLLHFLLLGVLALLVNRGGLRPSGDSVILSSVLRLGVCGCRSVLSGIRKVDQTQPAEKAHRELGDSPLSFDGAGLSFVPVPFLGGISTSASPLSRMAISIIIRCMSEVKVT